MTLRFIGSYLMRIIVVLLLLAIIVSLGSGLYHLTRDQSNGTGLVRALTWRIGLSVFLFAVLIIAGAMGWIKPGGV
ncbi:MAG: twin transmembrane helix small protein [Pseudomonadota bacterium]